MITENAPALPLSASRADARWLMLLSALVLLLVRCPDIWLQPRLWAEEGTVYLPAALANEFGASLLLVHQGYYSLLDNLVMAVAVLFPLQYVAHFTVYTALLLALVPALIVLTLPSRWWPDVRSQALWVLALLLLAGEEIYLNLVTCQFHLAAACALLLVVDFSATTVFQRRVLAVLLVTAALSSPQSCFLLPAFLLRAFASPNHGWRWLVLVFMAAVAVQVACVATAAAAHGVEGGRGLPQPFDTVQFLKLLVRYTWLNAYYRGLRDHWHARTFYYIAGYLLLLGCLWICWRARKVASMQVLTLALLTVTLASMLFSIDMIGGGRYGYASAVLVLLIATASWQVVPVKGIRQLMQALLMLALLSQASTYRITEAPYYDSSWPSWRKALQNWRDGVTPAAEGVVVWPLSAHWRAQLSETAERQD